MDFSQLLRCHIKDGSVLVKSLSEDEMTAFHQFAQSTDNALLCRYARLLVCRGDSLRLLSLCKNSSVDVSRICSRYLKTAVIRKDMIKRLSSEEDFIALYNDSCQVAQQALIECLIWNKNRYEGCLADRLYKNPSLKLSPEMKQQLALALSPELSVLEGECHKKYYKIHRAEMEDAAFGKLYQLYNEFKSGVYENKSAEMVRACDSYLAHIRHPFMKREIDGKTVYLHDILLELWDFQAGNRTSNSALFHYMYNVPTYHFDPEKKTVVSFKPSTSNLRSLNDFMDYYFHCTPYYVIKKLNLLQYEIDDAWYCLELLQCCRLFHDDSFTNAILRNLVQCLVSNTIPSNLDDKLMSVLTEEELATLLEMLMDAVLKCIEQAKSDTNVFTKYCSVLDFIRKNVSPTHPKFLQLLEKLVPFEKLIAFSDYLNYLSYLQEEVPFDFSYNMGTKDMNTMFSTVRKFESIICVKGNTYLNRETLVDRQRALDSVFVMAIHSHDVRCVLRCLRMVISTELKYNDINLSLNDQQNLFNPDSLGLSPKSLERSGSEEMAKFCRDEIIKVILAWAKSKKADIMVQPLMYVISYLYFYATECPEYVDTYTQLMEPLVRFLVDKNLVWTAEKLNIIAAFSSQRATKSINQKMGAMRLMSDECKERRAYLALEKYMKGEMKYLPKTNAFGLHGVLLAQVEFPSTDVDVNPLAVKPLRMILNLLNDPTLNRTYIAYLFDKLVSLMVVRRTTVVEETSDLYCNEAQNVVLKAVKSTTLYSKDYSVLDQLSTDMTLQWEYKLPELSVLSSLIVISNVMSQVKSMLDRKEVSTKHVVGTIHPPEESKPTLINVLNKRSYYLRFMEKNENLIDGMVKLDLDQIKKSTTQYENTVNNITFTEEALKWMCDNVHFFSLTSVLHQQTYQDLRKSLSLLQDSTLCDIASISMLQLHVIFQGIVTTISINRSSNPIRTSSIVASVQQFHGALLNALSVQILINRELKCRGIIPQERMHIIKTTSSFLYDFLRAVASKSEQSIVDMKKEDITPDKLRKVMEVSLDFSDNDIVGRFIETLVYSRTIKEYFGKELSGIVPVVLLMDLPLCFKICTRLLLTTTFVSLAETIIRRCLMNAGESSNIVSQIMNMLSSASKSMTVAVILLLIRVASNPLFKSKDSIHNVVVNVVTNIIENGFSSIDVYLLVIQWIVEKYFSVPDVELDYYNEILMKMKKIDPVTETGKAVFSIIATLMYYCTVDPEDNTDFDQLFHNEWKYANKMKSFLESRELDSARKESLSCLLQKLIMSFNMESIEEVKMQCMLLLSVHSTLVSDEFIEVCRDSIKRRRDQDISPIFVYLFTLQPEKTIELYMTEYESNKALVRSKRMNPDMFVEGYVPLSLTEMLISELSSVSSYIVPDGVIVEFFSSLPAIGWVIQVYAAYCRALSKVLPREARLLSEADLDVALFVDELDKEIAPWMYEIVHLMPFKFFNFSEEVKKRLMEEFRRRKSAVSALLVLRFLNINFNHEEMMEVINWIEDENVAGLYYELIWICLLIYCKDTRTFSLGGCSPYEQDT